MSAYSYGCSYWWFISKHITLCSNLLNGIAELMAFTYRSHKKTKYGANSSVFCTFLLPWALLGTLLDIGHICNISSGAIHIATILCRLVYNIDWKHRYLKITFCNAFDPPAPGVHLFHLSKSDPIRVFWAQGLHRLPRSFGTSPLVLLRSLGGRQRRQGAGAGHCCVCSALGKLFLDNSIWGSFDYLRKATLRRN